MTAPKPQLPRFEFERAILGSDLPSSARLIALYLATLLDRSLTVPARYSPSLQTISKRTGLGQTAVKTHLRTLELLGWLVRTPPSVDAARREHAKTRYRLRIPAEARSPDDHALGCSAAEARSPGDYGHGRSAAEARSPADHTHTFPSPSPQPEQIRAVVDDLAARRPDLDAETARQVVEHMAADPQTRSLKGRVNSDDAVAAVLALLRAADQRQANQRIEKARRDGPECPHGEPGGALPITSTGEPLCATCRAAARKAQVVA